MKATNFLLIPKKPFNSLLHYGPDGAEFLQGPAFQGIVNVECCDTAGEWQAFLNTLIMVNNGHREIGLVLAGR